MLHAACRLAGPAVVNHLDTLVALGFMIPVDALVLVCDPFAEAGVGIVDGGALIGILPAA